MNIQGTLQNNLLLLKKVFKYNKPLFFLRIFMALLKSVSIMLTIFMPMYLLDAIILGDTLQIVHVTLIFTIAYLVISFAEAGFAAYNKVASEVMYVEIINEFLQKTIDLDLGYFDNTHSYDKYDRAFGNCCKVIDSINTVVSSLITSFFNIIFITSLLIWVDVYIFAVIIAVIAISFAVSNRLKKIDYDYSVLFSEKNKQVNYLYRLFYIPQLVREVKSSNLSKYIFSIKQRFNSELIILVKEQVRKKMPFGIFLSSTTIIESSFVALYFGFAVVAGRIAVSVYFTCINAYNQLKGTIQNITSSYTQLYSNSLFAADYIEFLSSKENTTLNLTGVNLVTVDTIEFIDVSFQYPNGKSPALSNVSFKISKGDRVAIVGENGAGKTTITKLLLRLYDPLAGRILINGISITEYNTKSLRSTIKSLFQDFAIYAFSVRDNITFGENFSDAVVWDALDKVGMAEKIKKLPNSIDTPITSQLYQGGVEFSGGEAQRVAISRIYAANPQTFIMDEPTSSLDPSAEYQLYQHVLDNPDNNSIAIIISHRLTLTYKMSNIIVMKNGKVVEKGMHNELMGLNGVYHSMYSTQSVKFTADAKA